MGQRLDRVVEFAAGRTLAERAATLAAVLAVGHSFAPSLLPRKPLQQAVVTGLAATTVHGVVSTSQSAIQSVAARVVPGAGAEAAATRLRFAATANAAALLVGFGIQHAFRRRRRGESVKRAAVRTAGWTLSATGVMGLAISGVLAVNRQLLGRGRGELALPTGFILGCSVAAAEIVWYRRQQPEAPPVLASVAQGVGVMAGVSALTTAEEFAANRVASGVRAAAPGWAGLAEPIGHAVALTPLIGAAWAGLEYVVRRTEVGGAAVEDAYSRPPTAPTASGGPQSGVDWQTLGREGRRFVNMVLPAKDITAVTGRPAMSPVRAFVGLDSAVTVDARVEALMDELETLGAFDRSVLCLASPTGTGYVNYVVAESLEYMTDGDCATVALQYSLRPSFLSLDRVSLGREQNRALLHAIRGRLRAIPRDKRPRLVAVGESLGAFTLQDAFLHEGTEGLHRARIERALFIGTPAGSKWAEQCRIDPQRYDPDHEVVEVDSVAEWDRLPERQREEARYVLLSHHNDPICKFTPALAVQAPDWMSDGELRSPALPEGVTWRPVTTFLLTAVDLVNASEVTPGEFAARGHDYRADLARFTSIAFDLPVEPAEMQRIESALRRREALWAEHRQMAESIAQAREALQRQLRSFGDGEAQAA